MPDVKSSRLAAALLALLAGCAPKPDASQPETPAVAAAPPAKPPTIAPPAPPVARAQLLQATAAAASAYAAGQAYPEAAKLGGRQFAVRLAIGCDPAATGQSATYDAKAGVLRLSLKPETWTTDARIIGLVAESDTEAIEGFWIRWPWMLAAGCPRGLPPPPDQPDSPTQPSDPPSVGLVRLFGKDSSRLARRGARAYEATVKLDAPPAPGAYRVVISGRIADPPDHRPVRCGAPHRDRRPTCVVLIEPDRVAFETETGETIAEWTG